MEAREGRGFSTQITVAVRADFVGCETSMVE